MKTIQENSLNAVAIAVQEVNPLLAADLRGFIAKGAWTNPPIGRGQTIYKTFTPNKPIDPEMGKAVLEALESFSKTPNGKTARLEGMTIDGAKMFWANFIS